MAGNIGFGVVKEFLPDIGRAIAQKHKKASSKHTARQGVAD